MEILTKTYKKYFKYEGQLIGDIREECKLGFMLRVLAEVYQGESLPGIIDNVELLKNYLRKRLEKMNDPGLAENYLIEIGKALIEEEISNKSTMSGLIEENKLRERLKLSLNEKILPDLFAFNILNRIQIGDGLKLIGFYYTRIRDYVVSILSFNLPNLDEKKFKNLLPDLLKCPIGQSAISWYAKIAEEEHKNVLMEYNHARALLFLNKYVETIENNFPLLKERFEPYTSEKIGLVTTDISNDVFRYYGFRALKSEDAKLIEVMKTDSNRRFEREWFKLGVSVIKGKGSDFISVDPQEAAIQEVKEQLEKLIGNGLLNEEKNISLALEKIVNIIYVYGSELGLQINKFYSVLPRINNLLPIKLEDILKRIKLFYAQIYYEDEQRKEYIKNGIIKAKKGGYNFNRSMLNHEEIKRKAEIAVKEDRSIPEPNIAGDFPPYKVLFKAVKTIQKEFEEIKEPILPPPDIPIEEINERIIQGGGSISWIPDIIIAQYSDEQLKKYLESFFNLFIKEYTILVKACFPTYKDKFPFYSLQPIYLYAEAQTMDRQKWSLKYGCRHSGSGETLVEVDVNLKASKKNFNSREEFITSHFMLIEEVFHSRNTTPLDPRLNSHKANEICVLRNWVYEKIEEELKEITKNYPI